MNGSILKRHKIMESPVVRAIHSCDVDPPEPYEWKNVDEDCLYGIRKAYAVDGGGVMLGDGSNAVVYQISGIDNPHDKVAVKVLAYGTEKEKSTANAEVGISCHVNGLRDKNPVFVRTYGYLVCDTETLPYVWRENVCGYADSAPEMSMLLFMETHDARWFYESDKQVAFKIWHEDQAKCLFFMMAHAIYLMRKDLGGRHGDLHAKNILMVENPLATAFELRFNDTIVRVRPPFIPKLIDFGLSWTQRYDYNDWSDNDYRPNDMKELITQVFAAVGASVRPDIAGVWNAPEAFEQHLEPKYYAALVSTQKKWCFSADIVRVALLSTPLFKDTEGIDFMARNNDKSLGQCYVCTLAANYWMLGREAFFCSNRCVCTLGKFAKFLPKE